MGGVGEKIMVSVVTGVMSLLLSKLTNLIKDKYAKFKEVRKQLELLMKELIVMDIVLGEYAAMENPSQQMKAWMMEVRELAYDIEDCIDLFVYRVEHEPADNATGISWRILSKTIDDLKKVTYRYKFAEQIQELHARANEIYERRLKYKISEISISHATHSEVDPRLSALYVDAEKLVGIEGPTEHIINQLRRSIDQCRVISIVGSAGLGKTTLANQVYKSHVNGWFHCAAFVTVSRKPDMISFLKELISEIGSNDRGSGNHQLRTTGNERQLINSLRAYLQDKRYLIVVDDLWSASAWEVVQCALPRNNCSSRIIITTRIKDVARSCCSSNEDYVYEMNPLGEGDSKVLFLKRALGGDDHLPPQLQVIMNGILHKCDGLPLAIISIASLLASKSRTKDEWVRVKNSIGSVHGKDKQLEAMQNVLSIGYCDLPHHIKTCLLYLSIFPEDSEIDKDCLIWAWIAEGFISQRDGYSLKQVGESYFNELVNRSMVQPIGLEYDGTVRACRVHDVVLDFIISQSIDENFVIISDGNELLPQHEKIRRLSVLNKHGQWRGDSAISEGTMSLSHLRSFHLFGSYKHMPPLRDLQVLRAFVVDSLDDLSDIHFEKLTNSCQLRYLGLRNTIEKSSQHATRKVKKLLFFEKKRKVKKLSIQIEKLLFLQTLDLRGSNVSELPKAIVQLKQLMCLVADVIKLPDGFGNMEALEELWWLDISGCSLNFGKDLQKLCKLKLLKVSWLPPLRTGVEESYMTSFVSSLCKLGECSLQSIYIKGFNFSVDLMLDSWCPPPHLLQRFVMEGNCHYFSTLPSWIGSSLCNLTYLDIRVHKVEERDFHILKDLPGLLVLRLSTPEGPSTPWPEDTGFDNLDDLRIPTISSSGFQCLTEFCFRNKKGHGVIFGERAMPKLQMLDLTLFVDYIRILGLTSVDGDDSFDFGLRNLSSLRHIKVNVHAHNSHALHSVQISIEKDAKLLPNQPKAEVVGNFVSHWREDSD